MGAYVAVAILGGFLFFASVVCLKQRKLSQEVVDEFKDL
jgi:hypothetical protein